MKKITKKRIRTELDNFVANRQKVQNKELSQIIKKFSYLHFDNNFFTVTLSYIIFNTNLTLNIN